MPSDSQPPKDPALASVSGSVVPPFRVRLEAAGVVALYTLADEHLNEVWKTIQGCHSLDLAKEAPTLKGQSK
jgi:hypothetical protein